MVEIICLTFGRGIILIILISTSLFFTCLMVSGIMVSCYQVVAKSTVKVRSLMTKLVIKTDFLVNLPQQQSIFYVSIHPAATL